MIDHLATVTDVAALLPAEPAEKLHQVRSLRDDAGAIQRGIVERTLDARQARTVAEERLRFVKRPPAGRHAGDDHPAVITAQAALNAANAELARLQQHEAVISATFATRDGLVIKIERFLRSAASGGKAFATAPAVEPRLQKGEGILDAIERVRRQSRTIAADLHTVASAPVPSAVARQRMREQIEALAEMGRPNVSTLIEDRAGKVEFAEVSRKTLARSETPAFVGWMEPDAVALTAWLHRDALLARLDAEITEEADDKAALSDADRARKTKELEGDAAMVARQLAALVWQARADGLPAEFDEDADPLAVLGIVAVEMPRPATVERADDAVRTRDAYSAGSGAPFEAATHPSQDAGSPS